MSREIKFRAWDKKIGSMWPWGSFDLRSDKGCIYIVVPMHGRINDVELMQFTGLRDKNGKEIYEGDVVRLTYIKDEGKGWRSNSKEQGVVYFDAHWGVKFDCKDLTQRTAETHWKIKGGQFRDACDIEVIGNIHENPELLEKAP